MFLDEFLQSILILLLSLIGLMASHKDSNQVSDALLFGNYFSNGSLEFNDATSQFAWAGLQGAG